MASRTLLIIALTVPLLSGCEQTPSKADTPKVDLPSVYTEAAKAYSENNLAEAEKNYAILTRNSPTEAEPWFKLGNIYARTFRAELAIKAYRETLIREPQHTRAWHNLGIIQLREAANTFSELNDRLEAEDPLYEKSTEIQKTIDELVN